MQFRVLGALEVVQDGAPVRLDSARKPRILLAAMLAVAGRPVPTSEAVHALWGEHPPASATRNLQLYTYRLRRDLGVQRIPHGPPRFVADAGDLVDSLEFRHFAAAGTSLLRRGDPAGASIRLRAALDLWRGPAFAGLAAGPVADRAHRLEEERMAVYERWAEAQLWLGRGEGVLIELPGLLRRHPYRERIRVLLMRALHLAGRTGEALAVYHQTRRQLVEELGIEPGHDLQRQYVALLRQSPGAYPAPAARTRPVS